MDAEKISALVDGEVAEDVSDELSLQDVLLCNEYQLIGELVRASEPVRTLGPDFAAKMAKKLLEEAPHASPKSESAAQ